MTPALVRMIAFVELTGTAAGLLLAWSQPWFTLRIDAEDVALGGDRVASGLVAIALAVFALIAALALAGRPLRVVLGILGALLGGAAGVVVVLGQTSPDAGIEAELARRTGLSGEDAVATLVTDVAPTAWGTVAGIASILLVVVGIQIAATAARWPESGRRYTRTRMAAGRDAAGTPSQVDAWDALTAGDDPTRRVGMDDARAAPASEASDVPGMDR